MRIRRQVVAVVAGALLAAPVAVLPTAAAVTDTTAPQVTAVQVLTPVVTAGDPVVLRLTATDDLSGVSSLTARLRGPGSTVVDLASPDRGAAFLVGTGIVSGVVPLGAAGGPLALVSVVVTDDAGNSTTYTPTAVTPVPPGPTSALDLSTVTVTVSQPVGQDTTAPVLTSLRMLSSIDRRPGEHVTFAFTTSDDMSPVTELRVSMCWSRDDRMLQGLRGGGRLQSGRISVQIPADIPVGSSWFVCGATLTDSSHNVAFVGGLGSSRVDVTAGSPRSDPLVQRDVRPLPVVTAALNATLVPPGTTISLHGTVAYAGVAVPFPLVAVFADSAGVRTFLGLTRGTSTGTFSRRVRPTGYTVFHTYVLGSDRGGASSPRGLGPRARVWTGAPQALVVPTTTVYVRYGRTGLLAVTLVPRRSATVRLQRWTGRAWATVATLRTRSTGTAAVRVPRPTSSVRYRWTTSYDGVGLPAVSRTVTVRRA